MTEGDSVVERVLANAGYDLEKQFHDARQTDLSIYPTKALIENLKDRELSYEQANDLEEFISPLTKWE